MFSIISLLFGWLPGTFFVIVKIALIIFCIVCIAKLLALIWEAIPFL